MATFRTSLNSFYTLDTLLQLVNSNFYVAVAKDTPWSEIDGYEVNEENPPFPSFNLPELLDIKLYKLPYFKTVAVDSQCGVEFDSCGESLGEGTKLTLINLETTSLETLKAISPNYFYMRVCIEEDDLTFANIESFRALGLYRDTTFNVNTNIRYLPNNVLSQGLLHWTAYFTPIFKDTLVNKQSVFEIIIKG